MFSNLLSSLAQAAAPAEAAAKEGFDFVGFITSSATLDVALDFCLRLIGVFLLFFIGYKIAKVLSKLTLKGCTKSKLDETISVFVARGVYWLVLVVIVLACLSIFGIETTSVAAVLGAAGLAVGLAFQGTLSNFAAGVMIIVFRPFKLGDVVTVDGKTGCVKAIDFFQVELVTPDNRRIIVPNSKVYGSTIENVSAYEKRRVDVSIGVGYEADLDETRKILEKTLKVEGALEDEPGVVVLSNLNASSVDWDVRVWCKSGDYFAVRERMISMIKKNLDGANIEIPYPQITVSNKK